MPKEKNAKTLSVDNLRHTEYYGMQETFNEGPVLAFRIYDDDIVIGRECQIDHLPLGGEGLAGAGHAQDKAVAVEQFL